VHIHRATSNLRRRKGVQSGYFALSQPPLKSVDTWAARVLAATRKGRPLSVICVRPSLPLEIQFSVAVHSQVHELVIAPRCQTSGSEPLMEWGRSTGQRG
jgi:hypothetical protein